MGRGPLPRFRTYSQPATYGGMVRDLFTGRAARGDDIRRFEAAVARLAGTGFAIAMPQARIGIYMAVRTLIEPGQRVILSPYTIYDVVNMVICAGGIPVFADIERETCNLDLAQVDALMDSRTGAVLATHLHGMAMDIEPLAKACHDRDVAVVEDAAQALGARVRGKAVGSAGDAGVYSFGLYKNVNAFYGGIVVTDRADLHARLAGEMAAWPTQRIRPLMRRVGYGAFTEILTWPPVFRALPFHVFRSAYLHDIEALNRRVREENNPAMKRQLAPGALRRLLPAQARLAVDGLFAIERDFQVRLSFASQYHDGLADIDDLLLPPMRTDGSHVYVQYPVQYADRTALVKHMLRRGCDIAPQHMRNCADLECFAEFHRDCPNARRTADETIVLPSYAKYDMDHVLRNIRAIREFFGKDHSGRTSGPHTGALKGQSATAPSR